MRLGLPVLALMLATASACGRNEPAESGARPASQPSINAKPATGRIRGVVRFDGAVPKAIRQPNTKDTNVCGSSVSMTRLSLGPDNGVRHAFVYLDDAPYDGPALAPTSVLVDQQQCEYAPTSVAIAAGTTIDIINSDPILHNVHARGITPEGPTTIFNIAQPIRGLRSTVDISTAKPGIVTLSCEAGHPWMRAHLFVASHPYVAVTDETGEFVIDNVPPGTYPVTMWHEGVRVERIIESLQRYEYEPPYAVSKEVTVPPTGEAIVNFALSLRHAGS
jgi:plastocyanin